MAPTGNTRISFDLLAGIFDERRALPPPALAALHAAFGAMVDADLETLVEPGAGTGRIAIPALAAGFRVTAVDVSAPMLAVLARHLDGLPELRERCEVVIGDATALPLADDVFDVGVLAQVLYLIPAWERALDELVRVVRPGGRVLLLQERTAMSPELARWDAAWRDAVEGAGHRPIPQVPDDEQAALALGTRTANLTIDARASWGFGQTVGEALAGLDRLRPLYADLDDTAWDAAVAGFRRWHASASMDDATRLAGTVTLTVVAGIVPTP
jgi:SAM-dependent methyltransferase